MREKLAGMVLGAVLLTGLAGSAQAAAVAAAPVTEADGPRMVSAEPVTEKAVGHRQHLHCKSPRH